jgi:hypothetical protein
MQINLLNDIVHKIHKYLTEVDERNHRLIQHSQLLRVSPVLNTFQIQNFKSQNCNDSNAIKGDLWQVRIIRILNKYFIKLYLLLW